MSNFKFLLSETGVASFADVAIAAEKYYISTWIPSCSTCRRAMR